MDSSGLYSRQVELYSKQQSAARLSIHLFMHSFFLYQLSSNKE